MTITQVFPERSGLAHDIKMRNMRNLMVYLLAHGDMTKLDLLQCSGLSTTTVSDLINDLLRLNIVQTSGVQKSTGGRQPLLYRINNAYGVFLGITVERSALRIAATDMYARLLCKHESPLPEGQNMLYALYDTIDQVKALLPSQPILALGLGLKGRMDTGRGIVLDSPLAGWRNVPIKEILERRYSTLAFVDDTVHQGALYQQVLGHAQYLDCCLCYFSKSPDRAALILDGRLCRGEGNACLSLEGCPPDMSLAPVMRMLGVTAVVTDAPSCFTEDIQVYPFTASDSYFETSAALMAETLWFEQIYTMHTLAQKR